MQAEALKVVEALEVPSKSTHLRSPGPLHLWQPAWQPVHAPAALA